MNDDPISSRALTPAERESYKTYGYVLLKGLLSPEQVATTRDDVMAIMNQIGLGMTALKQTSEYLANSPLDALVNSPNLCQIASALMEGEARLYLPFSAVKSPGGGGAFHFHQDNQYTKFDGPGINLWVALVPMTEENGCLSMVPYSHYLGTLHPVAGTNHNSGLEPAVRVPVPMEPGDVVAFSRLTVHGSGKNLTDEARVAYAIQYARHDVRYTRDLGQTWKTIADDGPGWRTGPVEAITIPEKRDGH
ncbi:phytanoyl-CoA dioxygenase family protein [Armatimonas sp.]|uniref:phytanoyl-CoA dioxygenase family protein n=1 Tax=Armatimonas sp. TaxID=1872638 RepID=UPI00374DAB86